VFVIAEALLLSLIIAREFGAVFEFLQTSVCGRVANRAGIRRLAILGKNVVTFNLLTLFEIVFGT
jgi:hypothetical protein